VETSSAAIRVSITANAAMIDFLAGGPGADRLPLEAAARELEALLRDSPGNPVSRTELATVYALLGRGDDAVAEAKLAVDLTAKDKLTAGMALEGLALVYAHIGRPDEALDLVEQLLGMRYDDPLTLVTLRTDARWDPLRDHPRFKELLKRSA
jgi:tetratricopeptide (TPR) repeat protein